ncbi:hypothetical protein ACXHPS_13290, partial [Vibrio cincinnatiensis]
NAQKRKQKLNLVTVTRLDISINLHYKSPFVCSKTHNAFYAAFSRLSYSYDATFLIPHQRVINRLMKVNGG